MNADHDDDDDDADDYAGQLLGILALVLTLCICALMVVGTVYDAREIWEAW